MNMKAKRLLLILLAITLTVFPFVTAFAVEELPNQEITESSPTSSVTPVIEKSVPTQEITPVIEELEPTKEALPTQELPLPTTTITPVIEETQPTKEILPTQESLQPSPTSEITPVIVQEEIIVEVQESGVEGFVNRMYQVCLDRNPDPRGAADWVALLKSGQTTGTDIAKGFILSKEFTDKNLSDTEYIKSMYRAFFGREADAAGLASWESLMREGYSRLFVLAGFTNSVEFAKICNSYGIIRGSIILTQADLTPSIAVFVKRFYELCLQRNADPSGLNAWTTMLNSKQATAAQVSYGFVFSDEFIRRNTSNTEFVQIMYRAFFGREADGAGLNGWVKMLENGTSRHNVLVGFTNSVEFLQLCNKYNVERGSLELINDTPPIVPTPPNPNPAPVPPQPDTPPTISQSSAIRSAREYLDFMAFSRVGLIGQLEYVGFSNADATYAVDRVGADWNEQAVRSAREYLDVMAFSRVGLIGQLEYVGFTPEQARYGVNAVGL